MASHFFRTSRSALREVVGRQMPRKHRPLVRLDRPVAEKSMQVLDALVEDFIGFAWRHLVRPRHVFEIGQHVAAENSPDQARGQLQVDLEAPAVDGALIELVLREQEQPKVAEAQGVEGHFVRLVVLAETARPARACREEDVLAVDPFLAALRHFRLQEVDKVPGREGRRATGADVDQLLAGIEVRSRNVGQRLRAVVHVLHGALDEALMLPGQTSEEDRDVLALFPGEGPGSISLIVRNGRCAERRHARTSRSEPEQRAYPCRAGPRILPEYYEHQGYLRQVRIIAKAAAREPVDQLSSSMVSSPSRRGPPRMWSSTTTACPTPPTTP